MYRPMPEPIVRIRIDGRDIPAPLEPSSPFWTTLAVLRVRIRLAQIGGSGKLWRARKTMKATRAGRRVPG